MGDIRQPLVGIAILACLFTIPARAQTIGVRLSVKLILDENDNRPAGTWADPAEWENAINVANAIHERLGRGFRYLDPDFDGDVSGASQYHIIAEDRRCTNGHGGIDGAGACRDSDDCDNDPPCTSGEADCAGTCVDAKKRCANGRGGIDGFGRCLSHHDCDDDPPCASGEADCDRYCQGEIDWLEVDARNHPAQFQWRDDAINIYVVAIASGTELNPICNGWAQSPISAPPINGHDRGIVVLCANAGPVSGVPHELGHYFNLKHPWDHRTPFGDLVPDTPIDADPGADCPTDPYWFQWVMACIDDGNEESCCCKGANTRAKALAESWAPEMIDIMLNNLMSYHCIDIDDLTLSEGQIDWYASNARYNRAGVCTGVTYFVGGDLLRLPPDAVGTYTPYPTIAAGIGAANPRGGDIVLIRPGAYHETGVFQKPVTLRAPLAGPVTIGQ